MNGVMRQVLFHGMVGLAMGLLMVGTAAQADTVTRSIMTQENDVEEHVNTGIAAFPKGTMDWDSTDLELFSEGDSGLDWQVIGVQYNSLGIPQGSTINSATIRFTVDTAGVAGNNNVTIRAEAVDNSAVFTTTLNNVTTRVRTTASVAWAPVLNNTVGAQVITPNIAPLIQEIVNRPGWAPNNMLTIMLFPDAYLASPSGGTTAVQEIECEAFPDDSGLAWNDTATLTVDFTPPGPGGEGEGEGEGEVQGNEILSNVHPPFIDEGTMVILTAPPGSGWQWKLDGVNIAGATDRELILNPVTLTDVGSYTVAYLDGTSAPMETPAFLLSVSPAGSVPVLGIVGLAALAGAVALGGASTVRRRK